MSDSLASSLARLSPERKAAIVATLTPDEAEALQHEWSFWARPKQLWPDGEWRTWLILAGRGFGKTRCLIEWVNDRVERGIARRLNIVGATSPDVRKVLVEGPSGFLACSPPWNRPVYYPGRGELQWPNGAKGLLFSADEPDRLRGPQCDTAVADELAAWRYPDAWDQLQFGLRLGTDPRVAVATTPRPTPLIKSLVKDSLARNSTTRVVRGSTYENKANLASAFLTQIVKRYEGTRLGRQELHAEILDDAPGALWKRTQIEELRELEPPAFRRVVVAIDPSVSTPSGEERPEEDEEDDGIPTAPETGIIAAALGVDGHAYVLADGSLIEPTPLEWGSAAVALYNTLHADKVIGEVNNGGDLVEANVRTVAPRVPFEQVRASRGKAVRADPISGLYEQGKVHHVGVFPKLEDQMCQWEPGLSTWSPNRVDALVWALSYLMIEPQTLPVSGVKQPTAPAPSRWARQPGRGFG